MSCRVVSGCFLKYENYLKEGVKMMKISKKQAEILKIVQSFINDHGYSPTVREIKKLAGLKSSSTVYLHLTKLQKKGYITKENGMPRTLRVLKKAE
jgi:SOS-response transcriptional repressor LexA